jgi:hypothetical protein
MRRERQIATRKRQRAARQALAQGRLISLVLAPVSAIAAALRNTRRGRGKRL